MRIQNFTIFSNIIIFLSQIYSKQQKLCCLHSFFNQIHHFRNSCQHQACFFLSKTVHKIHPYLNVVFFTFEYLHVLSLYTSSLKILQTVLILTVFILIVIVCQIVFHQNSKTCVINLHKIEKTCNCIINLSSTLSFSFYFFPFRFDLNFQVHSASDLFLDFIFMFWYN